MQTKKCADIRRQQWVGNNSGSATIILVTPIAYEKGYKEGPKMSKMVQKQADVRNSVQKPSKIQVRVHHTDLVKRFVLAKCPKSGDTIETSFRFLCKKIVLLALVCECATV